MINRIFHAEDLQVFMKVQGLRIVRDYPELKTTGRCAMVSRDGHYLSVIKLEGDLYQTRFVKHDPNSKKGYTQSGIKQVTLFGKKYALHKLVAHTWLEKSNDPTKTLVYFKNGDFRDIRAENLDWTNRRLSTSFGAQYRKPRTWKGKWLNGFWIKPDKTRVPMTREQYLAMMEKERGTSYVRKIERDRKNQQHYKAKRRNSVSITNVNQTKNHQSN